MGAYNERLSVPVTWWLLGAVSIAILGAELWGGFGALAAVSTYVALALVCGATLVHWGSALVRVTDTDLLAAGRPLPLNVIGEVMALDEPQTRQLRGPRADPAAHVLIRPYLKRAVYIEVTDPGSTAPYWLIATRRPEELAAALGGHHRTAAETGAETGAETAAESAAETGGETDLRR